MSIANRPQSFQASDAERECAALIADLVNGPYTEPLADCLPIVYQGVRDNFTSSASPDGSNWPPRKVAGDGHPILIDKGALLQAATGAGPGRIQEVGSHDATIGVNGGSIPYAATHNYGRASGGIPQREFMGISEPRIDECEQVIADFVMQEIFG